MSGLPNPEVAFILKEFLSIGELQLGRHHLLWRLAVGPNLVREAYESVGTSRDDVFQAANRVEDDELKLDALLAIVKTARRHADEAGHAQIAPEHMMLALLDEDQQILWKTLANVKLTPQALRESLRQQAMELQAAQSAESAWSILGVKLESPSAKEVQESLAGTKYFSGTRIAEVRPDSPAARNDLRAGDFIIFVNAWAIDEDHISWVIQKIAKQDSATIFYVRQGESLKATIALTDE